MILYSTHFAIGQKFLNLFHNCRLAIAYCLLPVFFLLNSCQNSTKKHLVNKWDCVQIQNIEPIDKNFISKADSAVAIKIEAALKELTWTFNSNNTYQCSASGIITTEGDYVLSSDGKLLTLITSSKNNVNNYEVTNISASELTLTSSATAKPIIMHFKPH